MRLISVETSFHESVLDAVEDYHSSVLKSALQGWDCVVLSICINGQPVEVLESIEPLKNGVPIHLKIIRLALK